MPQDSGKIYPVKKPARDPSSLSLAQGSAEAITARLEEMERKIDRLRAIYETFFSGVERQPPNAPRRELNRLMLEMQQVQIRNAALRFRFQSLSQRWTLMTTYWNRTLREIEAGTYRKDVAKVSRRLAQKGAPLTEQEAVALGIPASRARALVARQAARERAGRGAAGARRPAGAARRRRPRRPPPPPRSPPPPRPSGVPGFSEDDLAALHRRYDEAARTTDRPAPTLEQLRDRLAKHVPQMIAHLGTEKVEFDVVVKDGRAVLRPEDRTPSVGSNPAPTQGDRARGRVWKPPSLAETREPDRPSLS